MAGHRPVRELQRLPLAPPHGDRLGRQLQASTLVGTGGDDQANGAHASLYNPCRDRAKCGLTRCFAVLRLPASASGYDHDATRKRRRTRASRGRVRASSTELGALPRVDHSHRRGPTQVGQVDRGSHRQRAPDHRDRHAKGGPHRGSGGGRSPQGSAAPPRILKVIKLAKDNYSVILQGVMRIAVENLTATEPFIQAKVSEVEEIRDEQLGVESEALVANIKETAKKLISLVPELPREAAALLDSVTDPGQVADLVISNLDIEPSEKQDVLESADVLERLRKVLSLLTRQLEILKVRERINSQVQEEMGPQPARVRAASAAQGDQGRARRDRRRQRRRRGVPEEDRRGQDAGGGGEGRAQAARPPQADAAQLGGVHGHADVPRVAGGAALVQVHRGPDRDQDRPHRAG